MPKIVIHPQVYHEIENGRAWYEERAEHLGDDFLGEIDQAIALIQEAPQRWPYCMKKQGIRRFVIHRFPYAIIYRDSPDLIHIFAVMHMHRRPGYWKDRI